MLQIHFVQRPWSTAASSIMYMTSRRSMWPKLKWWKYNVKYNGCICRKCADIWRRQSEIHDLAATITGQVAEGRLGTVWHSTKSAFGQRHQRHKMLNTWKIDEPWRSLLTIAATNARSSVLPHVEMNILVYLQRREESTASHGPHKNAEMCKLVPIELPAFLE